MELEHPERFISFPDDNTPLARWNGTIAELLEYTIPLQIAGRLSANSGEPMSYTDTVKLVERIFGITISAPYDRKTKLLSRKKNDTPFLDKMRIVFREEAENCIAESACYKTKSADVLFDVCFLFSVSSYPCSKKNTEIMDTCIDDLGMVNNTVKLLTKKEMAAELGISYRTVERWYNSGYIKRIRIGGRIFSLIPKCTASGIVSSLRRMPMSRRSRARRHGLFRIFYSSSSKVSTSVDELPDRDKDVQRVVGNARTHCIRHRPLVCTYVHGLSFGLADGDNHTCCSSLPAEQVVPVGRLQRAEYAARLRPYRLRQTSGRRSTCYRIRSFEEHFMAAEMSATRTQTETRTVIPMQDASEMSTVVSASRTQNGNRPMRKRKCPRQRHNRGHKFPPGATSLRKCPHLCPPCGHKRAMDA